jgi:large subunit ribosomal protein L6
MSRIGKKFIGLPAGVEATVAAHMVTVKGPKGSLEVRLHPSISVVKDDAARTLTVHVVDETDKGQKALWGLMRQLIANAVAGVQTPFQKALEFVGVGFKVALAGSDTLNIEVGFSHPVIFKLPPGVEAKVEKQIVTLSGIDRQLVGETAAQIRRIKPPEPYKGKGIKYTTEVIQRKAGKAASKGA